ncbi:MAG: hypothetical protein AABX10_05440 [Nanoarchaeota archaeon]
MADNSFIILNKKWENGKYILEIIKGINEKVKIIFTDYKVEWGKEVTKKIIKHIKSFSK